MRHTHCPSQLCDVCLEIATEKPSLKNLGQAITARTFLFLPYMPASPWIEEYFRRTSLRWNGLIVPTYSRRLDSRSLTSRKRHEEEGSYGPHENRFPEPPSWSPPTTVSSPASQFAGIETRNRLGFLDR